MKQTARQSGFTLIEIMVVMVILGLLVAVVAPNLLGRSDQARVTIAKTQMKQVGSALDLYKLDNNRYPTTEQGLQALVEKPAGSPEPRNWNPDGYMPSLPQDPWGNPYDYSSPGISGPYDLISYGADGREGGEDDNADINIQKLD